MTAKTAVILNNRIRWGFVLKHMKNSWKKTWKDPKLVWRDIFYIFFLFFFFLDTLILVIQAVNSLIPFFMLNKKKKESKKKGERCEFSRSAGNAVCFLSSRWQQHLCECDSVMKQPGCSLCHRCPQLLHRPQDGFIMMFPLKNRSSTPSEGAKPMTHVYETITSLKKNGWRDTLFQHVNRVWACTKRRCIVLLCSWDMHFSFQSEQGVHSPTRPCF